MPDSVTEQIEKLRTALATLESQRAVLGDAIEPAIAATRQQMEALERDVQLNVPTPTEERRLITILFTDIVGSTALAEKLDPEEWRQTVARLHETVGNIIAQHNGTVAQYLGDGLLAFFGAQESGEYDAENAIRAALEFQSAVGAMRVGAGSEPAPTNTPIQIRVGIHTGLVVVGTLGADAHKEFTATGDAMNLAARLQSAAPPGGILISHEMYRMVRGVFNLNPQPLLQVKGKIEPIQTYLVQSAKPRAFRITARSVSEIESRTIGRARELAQLQELYRDTIEKKRVVKTLLQGEPGIGKSRLMREMQDWVDLQSERVRVLLGRAFTNEQQQPFALMRNLWFDLFHITDDLPIGQAEKRWQESFRELTDIADTEPAHVLGLLVGLPFADSPYLGALRNDPNQIKGRGFVVSRQVLRALCAQSPVMILLEDLHWADQASLEYLTQVISSAEHMTADNTLQGIFVLATARNEWTMPATLRKHNEWNVLSLAPLPKAAAHELVNELLAPVADVPQHVLDLIVERAEGVPYFAEELVNYFFDRGIIDRTGDPWQFRPELFQETALPDTLQYLLRARLDTLPRGQFVALQRGAVYGRNFWAGGVEAMGILRVAEKLEPLSPRGLVEMKPTAAFANEDEWSFHHVLLRDVTYESVLKRERRALHQKAGEWIESKAREAGRLGEFVGLLGTHAELAGDLHAAAEWFTQAGDHALEQGAVYEARNFFEHALGLLPPTAHEQRWRVLMGLDKSFEILGENEKRQSNTKKLLELADEFQNDARRAEALLRQTWVLAIVGNYRACLKPAEQAMTAARRVGDDTTALRAHICQLHAYARLGEPRDSSDLWFDLAQRALEIPDDRIRLASLCDIAFVTNDSGDFVLGVDLLLRVIDAARASQDRYWEGAALQGLGYRRIQLGLYVQAQADFEQSLLLHESIQAQVYLAYGLQNLGLLAALQGQHDQARKQLSQAIQDMDAMRDERGWAQSLVYLALNSEWAHEFAEATNSYQQAADTFWAQGDHAYERDAQAGVARCAMAQGEFERARPLVTEIWKHLQTHGTRGMEFPAMAFLTCVHFYAMIGGAKNSRAALNAGYRDVMVRADKISNPEWRKSFLENVAEHRAMVEMYERSH